MQTVVIVNLGGLAWHLEEGAHAALGAYLDAAGRQLASNPDRNEILADLEQAIADKFGRYLGAHKNVVTTADMGTVLEEMGPVRDDSEPAAGTTHAIAPEGGSATNRGSSAAEPDQAASPGSTPDDTTARRAARRLYRSLDQGLIGGVCAGIAVFANLDPTLVRAGVLLAALLEIGLLDTPFVELAYVLLMVVIPAADTPEARAKARGIPFSAQHLIDEAKANFDRVGQRDWTHTRRSWKQQRRWERRYARQQRAHAWQAAWGAPPGSPYVTAGSGLLTPLLSALNVTLFLAAAYVVLSMAFTGAVRGWPVPSGMPVWLACVGVFIAYNFTAMPLRMARRATYDAVSGPAQASLAAVDAVVSLAVGVALTWTAYHHLPELQDWLHRLPEGWRNVAASFPAR